MIVGAILTQNTAWKNVEKAVLRLKKENLLSVETMTKVSRGQLSTAIQSAGYFNLKASRLKNFLKFLSKEDSGNLRKFLKQPLRPLREKLLSINGIGPETADSILLYAAKKPVFVVDAYTRRIFIRLGLLPQKTSYETIQNYFMKNLPLSRRLFNEYHALIVAHAKRICSKIPKCPDCPLKKDCQYAKFNINLAVTRR